MYIAASQEVAQCLASYLNNGYAQERASKPDGGRRGGHDRGTEKEADRHADSRGGGSTGDDLRLHGHEQSWSSPKESHGAWVTDY